MKVNVLNTVPCAERIVIVSVGQCHKFVIQ